MEDLMRRIKKFNQDRDWGKFHSPKNLAMAISVEVAEIVELFQWKTQRESKSLDSDELRNLTEEIGDVLIYLLNLSDIFSIDPMKAALNKLNINDKKYPVMKVRGKSAKYDKY